MNCRKLGLLHPNDFIKLNPSSMAFLKKSGLFATGHEDGTLRIWNLEIGSYMDLKNKWKF